MRLRGRVSAHGCTLDGSLCPWRERAWRGVLSSLLAAHCLLRTESVQACAVCGGHRRAAADYRQRRNTARTWAPKQATSTPLCNSRVTWRVPDANAAAPCRTSPSSRPPPPVPLHVPRPRFAPPTAPACAKNRPQVYIYMPLT